MQFLPEPNSNSNWNPPLSSRTELELIPLAPSPKLELELTPPPAPCPDPELQLELEPNSYSNSTPPWHTLEGFVALHMCGIVLFGQFQIHVHFGNTFLVQSKIVKLHLGTLLNSHMCVCKNMSQCSSLICENRFYIVETHGHFSKIHRILRAI